ncbi:hypothetical protein BCR42DRAFT_325453 [Absidia repens]|uniref:FAD/NAD(P)-binding domain-containing protein n=1 Tax=Absidia repens TaxID=90262 RepID=A0A1X2IJJ8_9FUNG|nr:hypothetical protein BCR42DRAFT_325453 [Absidia repens]
MRTCVIVGAGYAGIGLAKSLEKQLGDDNVRVILIDTKSHFYHSIGGLRAGVQDLDDRIFIPYSKLFLSSKNQVVHATVTRFDESMVYLDTDVPDFGSAIEFDFLVVATGMRYAAPARIHTATLEEGLAQLQHIRQHIRQATSILIVGGGPVGLELVGEIRQVDNEKKITLIHSKSQLGNPDYIPLKMHHKLMNLLTSSNVDVILNDRATLPSLLNQQQEHERTIFVPSTPLPPTQNGIDMSSVDLVLLANGSKPHVDWIKNSYPSLVQENDGFVKVKPTLQLDHPKLASKCFAIGDVAALNESKMAYRTRAHGAVVAANIVKLLQDPKTPLEALKKYKSGAHLGLITFGEDRGVLLLPWGIVAGNWISSMLKSKKLMIDRMWKELNQPTPPR